MIRIDRNGMPMPPALAAADSKAARELDANRELARAKKFKEMKFRAYKDDAVMPTLRSLFKGKCAYCEAIFLGQQPGDVEHFRPKGEVVVKHGAKVVTKRGYYWLAATWDNLMPSCADCNRPREQEIRGGPGKRVLGKANWFPVDPEKKRAKSPGSVANEPYLLIDPCVEDPALHLEFDDDGTINARATGGQASKKGVAAIEYCALARLELAQRRNARGTEVRHVADTLLRAISRGDSAEVRIQAQQLLDMIGESAVYSAYAKTVALRRLGPHRAALGL